MVDNEIESSTPSPERAHRDLLKLVQQSPTFLDFRTTLSDRRWWFLGDPMPEPFRDWTWADFENFYNENKR